MKQVSVLALGDNFQSFTFWRNTKQLAPRQSPPPPPPAPSACSLKNVRHDSLGPCVNYAALLQKTEFEF